MADPLSIGFGIVGVVGLTIQVIQLVQQFGSNWKTAPQDVKDFVIEIEALRTTLSIMHTNILINPEFRKAFEDEASSKAMGPTSDAALNTNFTLESCRSGLEKLLRELQPKESSVEKLNRHCQQLNNLISLDTAVLVAKTHNLVKENGEQQKARYLEEKSQKILSWISTLDFVGRQRDVLSKRHPGTGSWLLNTDAFRAWRDGNTQDSSTLWCPGIPGAGKTVMTSVVVEHLQECFLDRDVALAYVYCDYKDRKNQTTYQLISSLLKQVISQHRQEMHIEVSAAFETHKNGTIPLLMNECLVLLSKAMHHFQRCFFLVDALDEHVGSQDDAPEDDMRLIDELQQILRQTDHKSRCRLFVTSRNIGVIQQKLHECVRKDISASELDIRTYVKSRLLSPNFRFCEKLETDTALRNEILDGIAAKSHGMFLLPQLYLDRLGSQISIRELRKELELLPTKLDKTYDDAMERIKKQTESDADLALRALSWISYAVRPLRVDELQHALAIEPLQSKFDREGLCDENLLTSVAAGLISIDIESRIIRLVHFSVEEYFRRKRQKWFPDAEKNIAIDCLSYLSLKDFSNACPDYSWFQRTGRFPLLLYAAKNWGVHALRSPEQVVLRSILKFLDSTKPPAMGALQAMFYNEPFKGVLFPECNVSYFSHRLKQVHVFEIAIAYKLWETVRALLPQWLTVQNSEQWPFGKPPAIHLAASAGFVQALELFLDNGADIEAKDYKGRTALHVAVARGHRSALRVLHNRNANVTATDDCGSTALQIAASLRNKKLVKLLLEWKSKISATDIWGNTALHAAAKAGSALTVGVLLDAGADIAAVNSENETALHVAARRRYHAVVRLLLERGSDCTATDSNGWTVLHCALYCSSLPIMRVLLKHGADPSAKTNSQETALHISIKYWWLGDISDAIRLLLEHNVDMSIKDKDGRTALAIIENLIDERKHKPASTGEMQRREALESVRDLLSKPAVKDNPS